MICRQKETTELVQLNICSQADEAEATYRTCIADATTQQLELEHTKVTVLRQLQDVIKQSDQTLRSVRTQQTHKSHSLSKTVRATKKVLSLS